MVWRTKVIRRMTLSFRTVCCDPRFSNTISWQSPDRNTTTINEEKHYYRRSLNLWADKMFPKFQRMVEEQLNLECQDIYHELYSCRDTVRLESVDEEKVIL